MTSTIGGPLTVDVGTETGWRVRAMGRKGDGGPERNPTSKAERSLTPKQHQFCIEYVKHRDRMRAYRQAGYRVKNRNVAYVEAARLLRNPKIRAVVREERDKVAEAARIDAAWTIARFQLIYLDAMMAGKLRVALRALIQIAEIQGLYDRGTR